LADNRISKEASIVKDKKLVAQNAACSANLAKSFVRRKPPSPPKSPLVPKQPGIQLKGGSVFCLPAKSSHSSRIIIPNKRFLEDDYHNVEISPPKKPKIEHVSVDVKKGISLAVSSTYRCSKKEIKSDSEATASALPCKPDIRTKDSEFEPRSETKLCSSDVGKQDTKLGSENEPKIASTEMAEDGSLTTRSVITTGSILQKPKLCLDQTALDRSKAEFAKSLRSQMAQDDNTLSVEISDSSHLAASLSSLSTASVVTSSELRSISTSVHSSSSSASTVTYSSCISRPGMWYLFSVCTE